MNPRSKASLSRGERVVYVQSGWMSQLLHFAPSSLCHSSTLLLCVSITTSFIIYRCLSVALLIWCWTAPMLLQREGSQNGQVPLAGAT